VIHEPRNEPTTPSTIVITIPMFCLPGITSRASAPTIRPTTIAPMIVPIIAAPCVQAVPGGSARVQLFPLPNADNLAKSLAAPNFRASKYLSAIRDHPSAQPSRDCYAS
jgi:hypothetical protein